MLSRNYYAIVVVYNCSFRDTPIYASLNNQTDAAIVLCDNSTGDYGNRQFAFEIGCTYIDMEGNKGLPKAYNAAIDSIDDSAGVLCLFDDDTTVPEAYFKKLDEYFRKPDCEIVLPVVYDEIGLLSPSIVNGQYTYRAKAVEELRGRAISGINSGMAIDRKLFNCYRYDENMFLDFVDHAFIRDMRARAKHILIAENIQLKQQYSSNVSNRGSEAIRLRILKKDLRYFYKNTAGQKLYYFFVIAKRKIKLCLKYHTLSFLFL